MGQQNFESKKYCDPKMFVSEKNLGPKSLSPKKLRSKTKLGPQNFGSTKILCSKKHVGEHF